MTALRTEDPAVAIAMGRCLTARSLRQDPEPFRPTLRHDRECGWCVWDVDELQAAVREFNAWAQFNDRLGTSGRHSTRTFSHELKPDEQEALIVAAQALVEPEPMPAPEPSPPVVQAVEPIVQEDPSWAR